MNQKLIQAYRQTPWRVQVQWIGLFLLILLIIAGVAGFYLSITTKTSTTGRDIQWMNLVIQQDEQDIADRNTKLAELTSLSVMSQRAAALGYSAVDSQNETYVVVPGYTAPTTPQLAPPPVPMSNSSDENQSVYTESLWDWMVKMISASLKNRQ